MSYKDGFRWEILINGKKVKTSNKKFGIGSPFIEGMVSEISKEIRKGCLNCYGEIYNKKWEVVCDMENGDEPQTNILHYIADEIEKGEVEGGNVIESINHSYDHTFRMFDFEKKKFFEHRYDKEKPHTENLNVVVPKVEDYLPLIRTFVESKN